MTCLTQSLRPLGLARLDQRLASLTQARCLQFQLSECTLHLSMRKAFSGPTPKRGSFDTNSPKGAKSLARGHPVVQGDTCSLLRSGRRVMLIEQRKVSQDPDHTGRTRQSWDVGSCSPAQNLGPTFSRVPDMSPLGAFAPGPQLSISPGPSEGSCHSRARSEGPTS